MFSSFQSLTRSAFVAQSSRRRAWALRRAALALLLLVGVGLLAGCDTLAVWQDDPGENEEKNTINCKTDEEVEGRVVFRRVDSSHPDGGVALHSMNVDGSDLTQLSEPYERVPGLDDTLTMERVTDLQWGPDGEKIAFVSLTSIVGMPTPTFIGIMNADGSNKRASTGRWGIQRDPHWSPDGTKLLYTSFACSFAVVRVDRSRKECLTEEPITVEGDTLDVGYAAWGSTSDLLYLFDGSGLDQLSAVYLYRLSTGEIVRKVTSIDWQEEFDFRNPTLSPDGEKMLYGEISESLYYSYPVGVPEVLRESGSHPEWGNDSCHFIYSKTAQEGSLIKIGALGEDAADDQQIGTGLAAEPIPDLFIPESEN